MSCPRMLRTVLLIIQISLFCSLTRAAESQKTTPDKAPNVLFIAVDDLNDWVDPLGGHPQAKTP
ncbi:MAG: iduronate-2-sulfatase, partial [Isosphaeraceae bacterium]